MKAKIISAFLFALVTSCTASKSVSTLESDNYDEKTNHTTFTKIPFGSISIPGKWTKISYNQVSKQHNFRNADSVLTAIAINPASSYPFYRSSMNSDEIAKAFYEWDSKYLAHAIKGTRSLIVQDTVDHYIIWQITEDNEKYNVDNHYLFGSEKGVVFTVFISTVKWTNEQKINYLQTVYKSKTVGRCCD